MTKHLAGACLFLVFIIKMDEEAPIDHDENSYLEEKIEIEDLVLTDDSKIKVEITAFPTVIKKEKVNVINYEDQILPNPPTENAEDHGTDYEFSNHEEFNFDSSSNQSL